MNFSVINILKNNLKYILILIAITVLAYGSSLNNQFVWDDEQFIYNNAYVKNFEVYKIFTQNTTAGAGEVSTYYRPLTTLSFAIDYKIWGLNPFGFHLNNTLLHLSTGILLFFYLRVLKFSKLTSITIASIFLAHPLQTEAVVYANSRGDSMYAFFGLSSLLSLALLLTKKYPIVTIYDLEIKINKELLFFISVSSYILSILGKEIGIATLGLIFGTFAYIKLQQNNKIFLNNNKVDIGKLFTEKIFENILGILSVLFSTITAFTYLYFRNNILNIPTNQNHYFDGTIYGESLYVRLHTFTQAIWTYFSLIFFPYPLHMERSLTILENPISIWLVATMLLIVGLTFSIIKEYKKNNTFTVAFGSMWFSSMLVPVSGIIPVNGLIYEHWLYLPIIGFMIIFYGLKNTFIKNKYQKNINSIIKAVLPFIILILIGLTIRQNYIWRNPIRFYTYTLQFSQTARLHNNLAMAYAKNQDFDKAITEYKKSLDISDNYPQTHYNLANTYIAIDKRDLAKEEYLKAINLNENFMPAYNQLINIYSEAKEYEKVSPLIDKLLILSPENIEFKYLKAQNDLRKGEYKTSIKSLNEILKTPDLSSQVKFLIKDTINKYR